jgi:hypothetical protein
VRERSLAVANGSVSFRPEKGRIAMSGLKYVLAMSLLLSTTVVGRAEPACVPSKQGISKVIGGKNFVCEECIKSSCDTSGKEIKGCKKETVSTCTEVLPSKKPAPDKPASDKAAGDKGAAKNPDDKKPAEKKK